MPLFLYTLELEGGFYYVGTTNNPPVRLTEHREGAGAEWTRIHPPLCFSKTYKLKKLECSDEEARLQEDAHVKAVMLAKGIEAVRGGSYSRQTLTHDDVKALCKELFHATNGCLRCGRQSHWAKDCFAKTDVVGNTIEDESPPPSMPAASPQQRSAARGSSSFASSPSKRSRKASTAFEGCRRCGRANHTHERCYAATDASGRPLDDMDDEEEDEEDEEDEVEDDDCCFRCGRPGHWERDCYARTSVDGKRLRD